jgi:sec-independent protein translocase protein TatA
MTTSFLFIDFQEIVVILIAVVMLFGTKSLPEIARGLGQAVRQFRLAADDIKSEILNPTDLQNPVAKIKNELKENFDEIGSDMQNSLTEIKKSVGSIQGTITRDE